MKPTELLSRIENLCDEIGYVGPTTLEGFMLEANIPRSKFAVMRDLLNWVCMVPFMTREMIDYSDAQCTEFFHRFPDLPGDDEPSDD